MILIEYSWKKAVITGTNYHAIMKSYQVCTCTSFWGNTYGNPGPVFFPQNLWALNVQNSTTLKRSYQ